MSGAVLFFSTTSNSGTPSPSYDFSLTGASLPSGATLSRGSTGTYVNASGFLVSVGTNVPRFEFGWNGANWSTPLGLLIEPQATNLIANSQSFATSSWTSSSNTVTSNSIIGPDNASTGSVITATAATSGATTTNTPSMSQVESITASTTYSFSGFFAFESGDPYVVLELNDPVNGHETIAYDLSTSDFSADSNANFTELSRSVVVLTNGWHRIASTVTPSFSSTSTNFDFYQSSSSTTLSVNPNLAPTADLTTWNLIDSTGSITVDPNTYQGYPQYDFGFTTNRSGGFTAVPNMVAGTTYTVSVRVTGTVPFVFNFWDGQSPNDGTDQASAPFTPTSTNQLFTFTFKPTAGPELTIGLVNQTSLSAGTNVYTEFKVEVGSNFTGYVTPSSGSTPAPTGSRNYILGFYNNGSTVSPYHPWLGYYPDYNFGASFQQHTAGGGFFPPSELYPIVFDLDIYTNGTTMDYPTVASGGWDAQINATINSIPTNYYPYIYALRIDSEFNLASGYTAAGMTPAIYISAWTHVVNLCKAKLPSRVKYIFNPNGTNGGDISAYVPPACDIIGIDAYSNSFVNTAAWFNSGTVGGITWWTSKAAALGKPIGLPEWGYGVGSSDAGTATYINAVGAWANNPANNVVLLGFWDSPDAGTVQMNSTQQTAFQTQFGNISYGGTLFAPAITPNPTAGAGLNF